MTFYFEFSAKVEEVFTGTIEGSDLEAAKARLIELTKDAEDFELLKFETINEEQPIVSLN